MSDQVQRPDEREPVECVAVEREPDPGADPGADSWAGALVERAPEPGAAADGMYAAATRLRSAVGVAVWDRTRTDRLPLVEAITVLDQILWTFREVMAVMDSVHTGLQGDHLTASVEAAGAACGDPNCVACGLAACADVEDDRTRARTRMHALDQAMNELEPSRASLNSAHALLRHALTALAAIDIPAPAPAQTPTAPATPADQPADQPAGEGGTNGQTSEEKAE